MQKFYRVFNLYLVLIYVFVVLFLQGVIKFAPAGLLRVQLIAEKIGTILPYSLCISVCGVFCIVCMYVYILRHTQMCTLQEAVSCMSVGLKGTQHYCACRTYCFEKHRPAQTYSLVETVLLHGNKVACNENVYDIKGVYIAPNIKKHLGIEQVNPQHFKQALSGKTIDAMLLYREKGHWVFVCDDKRYIKMQVYEIIQDAFCAYAYIGIDDKAIVYIGSKVQDIKNVVYTYVKQRVVLNNAFMCVYSLVCLLMMLFVALIDTLCGTAFYSLSVGCIFISLCLIDKYRYHIRYCGMKVLEILK